MNKKISPKKCLKNKKITKEKNNIDELKKLMKKELMEKETQRNILSQKEIDDLLLIAEESPVKNVVKKKYAYMQLDFEKLYYNPYSPKLLYEIATLCFNEVGFSKNNISKELAKCCKEVIIEA